MQEYTAVIKSQGEWWYGWIEEIPGVNCQERSIEDLRRSLREAVREAIRMNREEALRSASGDYTEEPVAV